MRLFAIWHFSLSSIFQVFPVDLSSFPFVWNVPLTEWLPFDLNFQRLISSVLSLSPLFKALPDIVKFQINSFPSIGSDLFTTTSIRWKIKYQNLDLYLYLINIQEVLNIFHHFTKDPSSVARLTSAKHFPLDIKPYFIPENFKASSKFSREFTISSDRIKISPCQILPLLWRNLRDKRPDDTISPRVASASPRKSWLANFRDSLSQICS